MDFIKQNKVWIGGAFGLAILIYVYFTYFSGSSGPALSVSNEVSPVSQQLLVTLQSLYTIKLDDSIFKNSAFVSLTDFGVQIPPENVGRRNPFAPLGSVAR